MLVSVGQLAYYLLVDHHEKQPRFLTLDNFCNCDAAVRS
jgi:hypothetical protein